MDDRATPTPTSGLLARLGGDARAAEDALRALGLWDGDRPAAEAAPVVDLIAASPNVERATRAIARVAECHGRRVLSSHELVRRLAVVAGTSEALADVCVAHPAAIAILEGDLAPAEPDEVRRACHTALLDAAEPARALTVVQRLGLLRVAARDLLGLASTSTAAAELADLASGVLAAGLDVVGDPAVRLTVIGMGKLGGRELNYVSDVDVMFVHEGEHAAATRVVEAFLRLLGESTPEGRAYDVDANLRPEGRDGPLSRTLEGYRAYYDRWALTWEQQALLKARPVAGDEELGARFTALAEPYVWPDRRQGSDVDEIQRMKSTVESSAAVRKAGARQVKLAPGGIRDIEFAVQLLQLVHGRHDPGLRSPTTLEALAALAEGGYVDDGDANLFADAYDFLRTVEHRLQLRKLRRTHVVPDDDTERDRLARSCGFRPIRAATALEQFDREYTRVQGYVRRIHEQLFYRPLLDRFAELSSAEQLAFAPDDATGLSREQAAARLAALGFADGDRAMGVLADLAEGVSRRARLLRTLLPALLPVLAAAPDPDGGLEGLRSLADRLEGAPAFLRTLRDNPPVGEVLATVLGRSRRVGEWLEREPELISGLTDEGLAEPVDAATHARTAEGLLRRGDSAERTADALRRLKRRGIARIAVRDLTGRASVEEVGAELTGLADASLDAGLALAARDLPVRFAVLGMGKLGGGELSYASDLDVILVFEPGERRREALDAVTGLVKSLSDITAEGQAFRVDLDLRPEGRDGPVARTLESTRIYYAEHAEPWELQAMTQARVVAGEQALGEELLASVEPLVYPPRLPAERLTAMRRMKARVEAERDKGRRRRALGVARGDRIDLKLGLGGLADVEWTVQLLQLRLGGEHPEVRRPGALGALAALAGLGAVDGRDAAWLADGYRLLARVRNTLYLVGARDPSLLPAGPGELDRLAQTLGYDAPGGQDFVEDLTRHMRRVRKVHERLFYD
ncbi:MAG: bifunctional [glutamine synthetase] adenylyltransferase/[glutamine synthetase]-adenylyl-L-tyrosine phosphorylase [Actinomycetota bacterium]